MNLSALRLRTWNGGVPLPAGVLDLRCMRGASGIHLVLTRDDAVCLRAEIGAEPGEVVRVEVAVDEDGPHVSSRGRSVLLLPREARYDPAPPIRPAAADAPLDLAIVIDGTLRKWQEKGRLLDDRTLWGAHVEAMIDFAAGAAAEEATKRLDARVAVIAFGDQELPAVTAHDLRPAYRLYPAEDDRVLQGLDRDRLREALLAVPSTPGGDYVDALADALAAALRLRWREHARKLVLVSGDSPGASLLHPLPKGTDVCVRERDVDTQALALHRNGVEIATIHHAPPADSAHYALPTHRQLLQATRAQYERLASTRELAFDAAGFDATRAAAVLRHIAEPLGRRAALPELVTSAG